LIFGFFAGQEEVECPAHLQHKHALLEPGQEQTRPEKKKTFLSTPSLFPHFTAPHTVFSLKERFFIY